MLIRDDESVIGHAHPELARRARQIRLVFSDVDGVLTDAGIYYSARGEELKRFSARDGMGVELLREAGIETALLTREHSAIVSARAEKLGIAKVYLGVRDKWAFVSQVVLELALSWEQIAYIGDDVNDAPLLEFTAGQGIAGAPADAVPSVRRLAQFVTRARGGHGAFREFADYLLELRRKETP